MASQPQNDGWRFCANCGTKLAATAPECPKCGTPTGQMDQNFEKSPKSYGTAVALCGIFGTLGVHHFYLGNIMHGLFDFSMLVLTIGCWVYADMTGQDKFVFFGLFFLAVDVIHTIIVFYRLIVGEETDSQGRRVVPSP